MADGTALNPMSGGDLIFDETTTINGVVYKVQGVKAILGSLDNYTGDQGGRLVDGSASAAAAFVDPRPNVKTAPVTPAISVTAYVAGDSLGGLLDFGACARAAGSPLLISSAILIDDSQQDAPIDLVLFNAQPTNGTYTDHAIPTWNNTDGAMIRGVISFGSWTNIGSGSVCSIPNVGLSVVTSGTSHLWGLMIVRSTPTYAASALTVALEYVAE